MMKRNRGHTMPFYAGVVFQPALTPMEAAVLPAGERRTAYRGALRMARDEQAWSRVLGCEDQRQKICVR